MHADRPCELCGNTMVNPRPNRKYCSAECRMAAFEQRRQESAILAVQAAGVENVERQLAEGKELIELEGRLVQRESAWAAAAGIRATWGVDGARQTGRVVFEQGQWWAYVLVPLGEYPG